MTGGDRATTGGIAIVGMACRFGDARSPEELWQTVLSQRRAFRRIPDRRLSLADYGSTGSANPDHTYVREASVLEGWSFDRVAFHLSGDVVRSTDAVHWLALEVARDALSDAGFVDGAGLPRASSGVLVGNTLTGEFSRATLMRLRWPFVRRVVDAALGSEQWPTERRAAFLSRLETQYKAPFPEPGPESLAGALSNTIAGRICNFFDLGGGGYTVDGACASSLLAVTNACNALVNGDLDVAIAGGVDLSLDPFELVGFARAGALARDEMRVFDAHSNGFLPGEGCGMIVLMRDADAVSQGRQRRAVIRGWGISSDGGGGLTRPEAGGQLLALRRAYARAGVDVATVGYFEGHGTGTAVGDATELRVLSQARRSANATRRVTVGSIKANIGHTKAAAGVAGIIKAVLAVESQIIPPTTGCVTPHAEFRAADAALRVSALAELWPQDAALRAGVSAMGFGGINAHLVIDAASDERRASLTESERVLLSTAQDAELFVIAASDNKSLVQQLDRLARVASTASHADLSDIAATLALQAAAGAYRVAIVASTPAQLAEKVAQTRAELDSAARRLDGARGIFVSRDAPAGRIGFLFPGQGSPSPLDAPALRSRYPAVDALYNAAALASPNDPLPGQVTRTDVAQPAIVAASLAALHVLDSVGVVANVAIGHSLGELTAWHWAGAMSAGALQRLAAARGRAMADLAGPLGAMASIGVSASQLQELLVDNHVAIAATNSPRHTVISGEERAVEVVAVAARARGWAAHRLPVSHAFHSPLVSRAAAALDVHLASEQLGSVQRTVASTIVGRLLRPDDDLRALLLGQVTARVRFVEAVSAAPPGIDLWIEVGPGAVLCGLLSESSASPAIATNVDRASWTGMLGAVGAAFVLDNRVRPVLLFANRFVRPFDLDATPSFLANPCESAPIAVTPLDESNSGVAADALPAQRASAPQNESALEVVRRLVAECAELPLEVIHAGHALLRDLHLNSISVAQIAADAARLLDRAPSLAPTEFSLMTVAQVAEAIAAQPARSAIGPDTALPSGVDSWVRPFVATLVPRPLPKREPARAAIGDWHVLSPDDHGIAEKLRRACEQVAGSGLIVCLSAERDARCVGLMLDAARTVLTADGARTVCFVQQGGGVTAFARTLYEEARDATVCVVDVSLNHPRLGQLVAAELSVAVGFVAAHYDAAGARYEDLLEPLTLTQGAEPLNATDVVLVTGGAAGITAECALMLAQRTGARLVLMGRSDAAAPAIVASLELFAECGANVRYFTADVGDASATAAAIRRAQHEVGAITAIVHGAGINEPCLLSELTVQTVQRTLAPKVDGLTNVLAAVDQAQLRLVVAFGSTIGRRGLAGAASYALSNEWMSLAMERLQVALPDCRCLAIEWSVWSGVGIGSRSRHLDAMTRAGVMPIAPAAGAELFARVVAAATVPAVRVVVSGRYGESATGESLLAFSKPTLPLGRFLERTRVHYHGVELVVEADLSIDSDPYLADHVLDGRCLFPAVMALEAMAQVASAIVGTVLPPIFEHTCFDRAIVVPTEGTRTIRIAALVRESGDVDLVVRSAETDFELDHYRARCRFGRGHAGDPGQAAAAAGFAEPDTDADDQRHLQSTAAAGFYESTFFQSGRFHRVVSYARLRARSCIAEVSARNSEAWFGHFHTGHTLLGDAGARDAALHAVQACFPQATLVPIAVDRIVAGSIGGSGSLTVQATELAHEQKADHDVLVYDIRISDSAGKTIERWEGLRLRTLGPTRAPREAGLLGPYFERRIGALMPALLGSIAPVVTSRAPVHRARQRVREKRELVGGSATTRVRAPLDSPVVAYSPRHAFVVAGPAVTACDIVEVSQRPDELWRDMLTAGRYLLVGLVADETGEDRQRVAARVWCAAECLTKSGVPAGAPLVLRSAEPDGWVTFRSGSTTIVTWIADLRGERLPLAFAMQLSEE